MLTHSSTNTQIGRQLEVKCLPRRTSTYGRRKLESNPQPSDCKMTTLPTEPQSPHCIVFKQESDNQVLPELPINYTNLSGLLAQIYSEQPELEPNMEKQLLALMLHKSGINSQKTVKALKP
ncbi:hypothetical protein AMECASPLE_028152 [Ameca splendens]|uniref:Uncharacterized protein n=1 Tax=Ameca splendens TaxID=208324 RepID=A0ABV0XUK7_9TELE